MIARQQFYMAVRYDGSESNTEDLELASGNPGTSNLGDLDRLLEWHYQAVPEEFERRRNDVIYEDYQGNRNPFVDHPEFVHSVFVNSFNDTQLTLANSITPADDGSYVELDFGRVIVGSALPATQTVTVNKGGLDGTYYEVSSSSDQITSSIQGRYNAFARGSTGTQEIEVGIAGSTATAGLISGEITIDNLDITNSYGDGRANDDADDVIYASLEVLSHSNASFARDSDVNSLTIDFGSVQQRDDEYDGFFSIFTSDEDIPGAVSGDPLTLTLLAEVIAADFFDGDYDGDGFVSQADLDLVLLNWGESVVPAQWVAAYQFDGVQVSQNELDGVLLNWGNGTAPNLNAIPEPTTLAIVTITLIFTRRCRPDHIG